MLVELLNGKVWCEQAGEYVLMDDPARVHLTPKARSKIAAWNRKHGASFLEGEMGAAKLRAWQDQNLSDVQLV